MDQLLQCLSERWNRALPLAYRFPISTAVRREVAQPGENVAQFRMLEIAAQRFKNQREGLGIDGQFLVVILNVEAILTCCQTQVAALKLGAILVAKNRQQDFVVEFRLQRVP